MTKTLTPSESLLTTDKLDELQEDKKYHRSRSHRTDIRPEYSNGPHECNHVTGQFYNKMFKNFHPSLPPYQPMEMFMTPQSPSEQFMCDRLGFTGYTFNYPRRAVLTKVDSLTVESPAYIKTHANNMVTYPGSKSQRQELQVRWMEYLAMLNLPKGFHKQYPFIYNVLRDMFVTKIVMYRNMKRLAKEYAILKVKYLRQSYEFQRFYDQVCRIPGVGQWYKEHPEELSQLKETEAFLEQLSYELKHPELFKLEMEKILALPEYQRLTHTSQTTEYVQQIKLKYGNKILMIPEDFGSEDQKIK